MVIRIDGLVVEVIMTAIIMLGFEWHYVFNMHVLVKTLQRVWFRDVRCYSTINSTSVLCFIFIRNYYNDTWLVIKIIIIYIFNNSLHWWELSFLLLVIWFSCWYNGSDFVLNHTFNVNLLKGIIVGLNLILQRPL